MRIEPPNVIATENILSQRADGSRVQIQAWLGAPYQCEFGWACPAALMGVDGRYVDIVGVSAFQAIREATLLIRRRLGHQLEDGAILCHPDDPASPYDATILDCMFGKE